MIAPFSLFVMMPSVVPKKVDFSRGEILLYEKSGKLLKSVFIVCCKYIICHTIKVSFYGCNTWELLSVSGFCIHVVFHDTLPTFDGLEDFCTETYIRVDSDVGNVGYRSSDLFAFNSDTSQS